MFIYEKIRELVKTNQKEKPKLVKKPERYNIGEMHIVLDVNNKISFT